MFKKYKKQLIISSVLILLPIAAGLLLWDQLPAQMPTHWNALGEVDRYSSRGFAVFGLPLMLLAIHLMCFFATKFDKHNDNQTHKVVALVFWICPVISLLCSGATYLAALGYAIDMIQLPCILVGIVFLIVGNYLPKCRYNHTIGIKLPWTFASEENWNATHRFAGKVWMAGGILLLLTAFLPAKYTFIGFIAAMILLVVIPTVYSWRYSQTHG